LDTTKFTQQRAAAARWIKSRLSRFVSWMEDHTGRDLNGPQAVLLALASLVVGVTALALAMWVLAQIVTFIGWVGGGHAGADVGRVFSELGQTVASLPLVHTATDPIGAWAEQHAAGLPVSAGTLLTVWGIGGGLLVLGGLCGARGARVAWPLYGAATAAMAWFGAQDPHQPIAAGLIVLAWILLSILVLHRGGSSRARTHITNVMPPTEPAAAHNTPQPVTPVPLGPVR